MGQQDIFGFGGKGKKGNSGGVAGIGNPRKMKQSKSKGRKSEGGAIGLTNVAYKDVVGDIRTTKTSGLKPYTF